MTILGELWMRQENYRWTLGYAVVFGLGMPLVYLNLWDLNTWIGLFFAVGISGAIKVGYQQYSRLKVRDEELQEMLEKIDKQQKLEQIRVLSSIEEALREWFPNLAERIERIEDILLLLLASRKSDQTGVKEARRALRTERRESLKRQLKIHYRNLQNLEEQVASLGQHPPVEKLNAIEFARVEIERLEVELDPP